MIIAHPDRAYIGQSLAPVLRQVLAGYEGQTEYADPISGQMMLASYSPVGGQSGWGIVVEQEQAEAFAPINVIAFTTFGVLLIAIGLATMVTILIARSITHPLQRLAEATRTIARTGNLRQDVAVESQDEVGQLATTFNQMMASLRQAEQEIRELNAELEQRVIERTAELRVANQKLEAFAYSVSHDLRAPLRSIDGFSQALLEDYVEVLDATGQDYLQRVRAGSQRMGQLIDDLLKLSRLTRGEMYRETVDLSALAQKIAVELQQTQPDRQVEFIITPGVVVNGDPQFMRIVLENLLGNAWKFTGKHAWAKIEFGWTETDGQPTCFVRDDGAGFDMAYADKLFGAFQRLHSTAEFEGNGIGLAIVQRIIHRHGGRVWAEGAVEQGATFYFTL